MNVSGLLSVSILAVLFTCSTANGDSEKKGFNDADICKSAIGTMFYKDPSIINSKKEGGVYKISYVRKADNSSWVYKCKIDNGQVNWGSYNGRWRNHKLDSVVTYTVNNGVLTIKDQYTDGSATVKKYMKENKKISIIK